MNAIPLLRAKASTYEGRAVFTADAVAPAWACDCGMTYSTEAMANGCCSAGREPRVPRHLLLALANATEAFARGDIAALGTINENVQPLVDAAIAWAHRFAAQRQAWIDKALDFVDRYGGIDGSHHKQWVLDQVVRALTGTPELTLSAVDSNGKTYVYEAQGSCEEYERWVTEHRAGDDGPDTYDWDAGTPP